MQAPPELLVLLVAALPFSELRGAIPLALSYGMSPAKSYMLGVAGNLLPVPFLLLFLGRVERALRRFELFDRFFTWLFARTRRRRRRGVERYGALGIVPFVAVPLPVTGAWTGTALAYVFGIPFRYAFPAISAGVGIAGVIVTLSSLGALRLLG